MPVFCLSFHAGYRCAHSGACCTSGWTIPIEPPLRTRLGEALASGRLRLPDRRSPFVEDVELPDGAAAVLRTDAHGVCACYDRQNRRCAIHSQLGHDALPVACQHFPRVCLIDIGGTFVTLSHYCPTAARLLMRGGATERRLRPAPDNRDGCAVPDANASPDNRGGCPAPCCDRRDARPTHGANASPDDRDGRRTPNGGGRDACDRRDAGPTHDAIGIVEAPEGFAPFALEGLDARDALPPLLHPRMLADRGSYRAWERSVVDVFASAATPEGALERIIAATETIRRWEPARGPLVEAVSAAFAEMPREVRPSRSPALPRAALAFDALVRETVPDGLSAQPPPAAAKSAFDELVAPSWTDFARPILRYLSAKAFGSWCAYQGRGLRTVVCSLIASVSVLRVELARRCAEIGRAPDEALLVDAFREADLLLVHLASREELARRFSEIEEAPADVLREAV